MKSDTIAAIASGTAGAVSIIRVSGSRAFDFLSVICDVNFSALPDRFMKLVRLKHNEKILDDSLVVKFTAPHSFTGENMAEIHCHGGSFIPSGILSALIEAGVRLAEAGEFTMRAFLNGKLDLARAEGVADIINAESRAEADSAFELYGGTLSKKVLEISDILTDILAEAEASLDYPEENLSPLDTRLAEEKLKKIAASLHELAGTYNEGRSLREGVRVVIAGNTNAGKSSLFNSLLGRDSAIVTEIEGTTTDTKTETIIINGVKFLLTDTAGVRKADRKVEVLGVERAINALKTADIVLLLIEPPLNAVSQEILDIVKNKRHITVYTKSDKYKVVPKEDELAVSAHNGEGISELKNRIYSLSGITTSGFAITNLRHFEALKDSEDSVNLSMIDIHSKPSELLATDLRHALTSLESITGQSASEALLTKIFSKFCLGK